MKIFVNLTKKTLFRENRFIYIDFHLSSNPPHSVFFICTYKNIYIHSVTYKLTDNVSLHVHGSVYNGLLAPDDQILSLCQAEVINVLRNILIFNFTNLSINRSSAVPKNRNNLKPAVWRIKKNYCWKQYGRVFVILGRSNGSKLFKTAFLIFY